MQTQPSDPSPQQLGLLRILIGDGRSLLSLTGLTLFAAGVFATLQAMSGHLLPHDQAFLGITATELATLRDGRVLHFMIHDRVAFGGALVAIGTLYLYLANVPLAQGKAWAWWAFLLSGAVGFASFLTYLGYGYIDSWHAVATLMLLPVFLTGMVITERQLKRKRDAISKSDTERAGIRALLQSGEQWKWRSKIGVGRALLLFNAGNLALGGLIIMTVGMTSVFVPQDLAFMDIAAKDLDAFNPRLIPLIAHDRAGFGGAVFCVGVTLFLSLWCSKFTPALWQSALVTGAAGYGTAIGVHYPIGYTSFTHLAPAFFGATVFITGMALTWRKAHSTTSSSG